MCAALLRSLDREYRSLIEDARARDAILRRFEASSSSVRGRKVTILMNGDESGGLTGVTEGLDERGFLQVRTAEGVRTVVSGTVRLEGHSPSRYEFALSGGLGAPSAAGQPRAAVPT